MKTLNINANGGMPIYVDDLRFIDSIYREAFEAIMKPIAENNNVVIISGCSRSVTSGTVTVDSGWVLYNGEVVRVNQHSYPEATGSDNEYWTIATVDVPGGHRDYFDGSDHEAWREKIALIEVGVSVPPNSLIYSQTKSYWQAVKRRITPYKSIKGFFIDGVFTEEYNDTGEIITFTASPSYLFYDFESINPIFLNKKTAIIVSGIGQLQADSNLTVTGGRRISDTKMRVTVMTYFDVTGLASANNVVTGSPLYGEPVYVEIKIFD